MKRSPVSIFVAAVLGLVLFQSCFGGPNPEKSTNGSIVILKMEGPEYPRLAKLGRLQGTLRLAAEVNSEGKIVKIRRISFEPETTDRMVDVLWEYVERLLAEKWQLQISCSESHERQTVSIEFVFALMAARNPTQCPPTAKLSIEGGSTLKIRLTDTIEPSSTTK